MPEAILIRGPLAPEAVEVIIAAVGAIAQRHPDAGVRARAASLTSSMPK
jgi:hypothetical protein